MTGSGELSAAGMRLQKALALAGVGSRRHCEELISAGRVQVNGVVVTEMGTKVIDGDRLAVDGHPVGQRQQHVYYALNKPSGYVSTSSDPQGRPTVLDLVPQEPRVYPVGRLDFDSEGLIILTNDGDLTQLLLHPSHEVDREYNVLVMGAVTEDALVRLRDGVVLDGQPTAPAGVRVLETRADEVWLQFIIHEGRQRQVRRMCEAVDLVVRRLIRVRVGSLGLGDLPSGRYRILRDDEVQRLNRASRVGTRPQSRGRQAFG